MVERDKLTQVNRFKHKSNRGRKKNIPIEKCFYCGECAHWKKEYPHFLAKFKKYNKKGKCDLLSLESCIDV